jgi:hypothetical protein
MTKLRRQSPFIAIALGSLALLLVACAPTASRVQAYTGPAQPAEEVALLSAATKWNSAGSFTEHETAVLAIDGQAINYPVRIYEVEILPGAHKVRLQYVRVRQNINLSAGIPREVTLSNWNSRLTLAAITLHLDSLSR